MSAALRPYALHAACAVAIAVEVALAAAWHRDRGELERAARSRDSEERVWALHVSCNRGALDSPPLSESEAAALASDADPLAADLAFTIDVCRLHFPMAQERAISRKPSERVGPPLATADLWRRFALLRRKVGDNVLGSRGELSSREAAWFVRACRGGALDAREIEEHLESLGRGSRARSRGETDDPR